MTRMIVPAQQDAEPAEEEVSLPAGEVAAQEGDEPGAQERHEAGDDRNESQALPHAQADAGGRGERLVGYIGCGRSSSRVWRACGGGLPGASSGEE